MTLCLGLIGGCHVPKHNVIGVGGSILGSSHPRLLDAKIVATGSRDLVSGSYTERRATSSWGGREL